MHPFHHTMMARQALRDALGEDLERGIPVGVGVSGGSDSLALLAGLSTLYKGARAPLVHVVSVDHQLQEVTKNVSQHVAEVARGYGFTAHAVSVTVEEAAQGPEGDARRARYGAFEDAIQREGLERFLLGHTKNDQAEQVLLGLMRGSGTKVIAGMPRERGVYLRPFLHCLSKQDTRAVCAEQGLTPWEDPHNDHGDIYRRVAVRRLLQQLRKATGADLTNALVRSSQLAREDDDALTQLAGELFERLELEDWPVSVYEGQPPALRKRALRMKLATLGVPEAAQTYRLLERCEALVTRWHGQGAVAFKDGVSVARDVDRLRFS